MEGDEDFKRLDLDDDGTDWKYERQLDAEETENARASREAVKVQEYDEDWEWDMTPFNVVNLEDFADIDDEDIDGGDYGPRCQRFSENLVVRGLRRHRSEPEREFMTLGDGKGYRTHVLGMDLGKDRKTGLVIIERVWEVHRVRTKPRVPRDRFTRTRGKHRRGL